MLVLLQLSDSAFPSGGFVHSYGLEQALRDGRLTDAAGVEVFVQSVVTQSVATSEALAAREAARAAQHADVAAIVVLDRALLRTKAASELRTASLQTGRRLVEEAAVHVESAVLKDYACELSRDGQLGCYAVAFGVVSAALDAEPDDVPAAFMLSSANALLQAAMRLGRISHRDAQGALHRLRPVIEARSVVLAHERTAWELQAFHPLQEIASMRHARAEARLFAS